MRALKVITRYLESPVSQELVLRLLLLCLIWLFAFCIRLVRLDGARGRGQQLGLGGHAHAPSWSIVECNVHLAPLPPCEQFSVLRYESVIHEFDPPPRNALAPLSPP